MGRNLNPFLERVLRRLLQALFSLWLLATLCFFLLQVFPGSPFADETALRPEIKAVLIEKYGLEKNIVERYGRYLISAVRGDFGASMHFVDRSVPALITQAGAYSFRIGILSLLLSVSIAFMAALFFSQRPKTEGAYQVFTIGISSLPSLLIGPFMIWLFAFQWDLLPAALLENWQSYVMPVFVLSLRPIAALTRILKTQISEQWNEDYVRTFRSMGVSEAALVSKHVLRNAMIPVVSYLGPLCVGLVSGSILVEMMFGLPGLGSRYIESILNRDYPLIMGMTLFYGFLLIMIQLFVDLLIEIIDPRVKAL